jgi:aspartyl protease family protein
MATGFTMRNFIGLWLALAAGAAVAGDDVALIGVIGDKAAVLALDGGEPKTVKLGQTWNGITVLSVRHEEATVDVKGEKRVLHLGQHYRSAAPAATHASVTLAADSRGHFFAEGAVNGVPVRFVVDTGATMVSLPKRDAERLGINYRSGRAGMSNTANGPALVYLVTLDSVRVGGIELHGVAALVHDSGLEQALLGMSFLNRVGMQRDGATMTLVQRF